MIGGDRILSKTGLRHPERIPRDCFLHFSKIRAIAAVGGDQSNRDGRLRASMLIAAAHSRATTTPVEWS